MGSSHNKRSGAALSWGYWPFGMCWLGGTGSWVPPRSGLSLSLGKAASDNPPIYNGPSASLHLFFVLPIAPFWFLPESVGKSFSPDGMGWVVAAPPSPPFHPRQVYADVEVTQIHMSLGESIICSLGAGGPHREGGPARGGKWSDVG